MNKTVLDLWVGLFVIAGIVALLFLALKVGSMSAVKTSSSYEVVARFDNIGGLKPRAAVRSAGVTIGRVASIKLDAKTYQGVVRLEIDKGVQFPKDSQARILTAGLLGDQYIGLEPGAEEKTLVAGDTITQTQSAVVLDSLISQFLFNKAAEAGGDAGAKK